MTKQALPVGWVWTTLGEVAEVIRGVTYKKSESSETAGEGMVPLVRATNISASLDTESGLIYVPSSCVSPMQKLRANDIVLAASSGSISVVGKSARLVTDWDGTFGAFCAVLRPRTGVSAKYIALLVISDRVRSRWSAVARGTSINNLKRGDLLETPVPLPPLPEQHRIVEALEGHLSRLDAADAGVRSAVARTSSLIRGSHRAALFCTDSADSVRIGDIAKVGSGATPLRGNAQYYDGGTIPWVTSGDLHARDIFDVPGRVTETALQETAVKLWPAGTLLVAMYGEGKTRGTVAELHIASTTNQACAAIVLHPEFADLKYWVRFLLRTRYDEMRSQASGGVQPNLSLGRIKEISIPMPDVEVRNAILAEDEANNESVDRLRLAGEKSLARSTALRRSLLRAAFNGELVDQDLTDEPADAALAMLRATLPARPVRERKKTRVTT